MIEFKSIFDYIEAYLKRATDAVKCVYNPSCDLAVVSQSDVLDVASAFVNGLIPEDVTAPDTRYNGIDEPSAILGKASNAFDALHMQETIRSYSPSAPAPSDNQ